MPNPGADTAQEHDDVAFKMFATLYPHEAYAEWPDRFWAWFHEEHPNIDRARLEVLLAESDTVASNETIGSAG